MDYSDDGSDGASSDDGNGSDAFEAPPVVAQDSRYHVFSPEECLRQAEAKVKDVCELLCCQPDVAHLLLRHFRWDHDKLTDGDLCAACCLRPEPCCCARALWRHLLSVAREPPCARLRSAGFPLRLRRRHRVSLPSVLHPCSPSSHVCCSAARAQPT